MDQDRNRKISVLIANDSRTVQVFTKDTIEKNFHINNVTTALNGEEALYELTRKLFDLVITDWNMPKMNGDEFMKMAKENEKTKDVPFIMLTARNDKESVMSAIEHGVSAYMVKPFTQEALIVKIEKLLGVDRVAC